MERQQKLRRCVHHKPVPKGFDLGFHRCVESWLDDFIDVLLSVVESQLYLCATLDELDTRVGWVVESQIQGFNLCRYFVFVLWVLLNAEYLFLKSVQSRVNGLIQFPHVTEMHFVALYQIPHQRTDRQIDQAIVNQGTTNCDSSDFHFFTNQNQVRTILKVRFREEHPIDRVCSPKSRIVLQGFS